MTTATARDTQWGQHRTHSGDVLFFLSLYDCIVVVVVLLFVVLLFVVLLLHADCYVFFRCICVVGI